MFRVVRLPRLAAVGALLAVLGLVAASGAAGDRRSVRARVSAPVVAPADDTVELLGVPVDDRAERAGWLSRTRVPSPVVPLPPPVLEQPVPTAGPIPAPAYRAYHLAAATAPCPIGWWLLAGIGKVESNHGRFGGNRFTADGTVVPGIEGPPTPYGTAKGPMQFIDSTWALYGGGGNVQNIADATRGTARLLCDAVDNANLLTDRNAQRTAVFAYNHLDSYVADVLAYADVYRRGASEQTVQLVPIVYPKDAPAEARLRLDRSPVGRARVLPPPTSGAPAPPATSGVPTSSAPRVPATKAAPSPSAVPARTSASVPRPSAGPTTPPPSATPSGTPTSDPCATATPTPTPTPSDTPTPDPSSTAPAACPTASPTPTPTPASS